MAKRVFAWVLLIGFVFLIVNILVIGYQRTLSAAVYAVIALVFLFTTKSKKKSEE